MFLDARCGACQHRAHEHCRPAALVRRPPSRPHAGLRGAVQVAIVGSGPGGRARPPICAGRALRRRLRGALRTQAGAPRVRARTGAHAVRFDVGLHYVGDCGPEGKMRACSARSASRTCASSRSTQEVEYASSSPTSSSGSPFDLDRYRDRLVGRFPHERKGIDAYVKLGPGGARRGQGDGRGERGRAAGDACRSRSPGSAFARTETNDERGVLTAMGLRDACRARNHARPRAASTASPAR